MLVMRNQILNALSALSDLREYDRFQELAFHLARTKWPGLRLTRKNNDLGADALDKNSGLALACGWNGGLSKLKDDCETIQKERPSIKQIVFATSRAVQENTQKNWTAEAKKFGLELVEIIHRDWIIGELVQPSQRWLAYEYLDVPIGEFADLKTQLPLIRTASEKITTAWAASNQFQSDPHLDLRLREPQTQGGSDAVETPEHLRLSMLKELIIPGMMVWLTGVAGAGKTLALVDYARSLLSEAENRRFPVLVSLRQWALQDKSLFEYITNEPAFLLQGITPSTVAVALEAGNAVLLLNGWNEIPSAKTERLGGELLSMLGQMGGAAVVVTCRTVPDILIPKSPEHWVVCNLNDDEIREAVASTALPNPFKFADRILAHAQLSGLARIPLFLWEIIRQGNFHQDGLMTRFSLLEGMVLRACGEHTNAILIEQSILPAERILKRLAAVMTDEQATAIRVTSARKHIAEVIQELLDEFILSGRHNSDQILRQLTSCHLLVEEDGGSVFRFSHHLIQEYFAATEIADFQQDGKLEPNSSRIQNWAWNEPIQLAIECLCRRKLVRQAGTLALDYSVQDFAGACQCVGLNTALWEHLCGPFRQRIRELSVSADINANWLAARYAATTGQSEFSDIVFNGLAGHPTGSGNPYTSIPSEIVFCALGPNLIKNVSNNPDEGLRILALADLAESGTEQGIALAKEASNSDSSSAVRKLAYEILFNHGTKGMFRPFIREVIRQGGWDEALLNIAAKCPEISIKHYRKRQWRYIQAQTEWQRRNRAFHRWHAHDPEGADAYLKEQYLWLWHAEKECDVANSEKNHSLYDFRLRCLRWIEAIDPQWASEMAINEARVPDFWKFGSLPPRLLPEAVRDEIVLSRIKESLECNDGPFDRLAVLVNLAPHTSVRWCLRRVLDTALTESRTWDRHVSLTAVIRRIDRTTQIEIACEDEFKSPPAESLPRLVDAINRSKADEVGGLEIADELAVRWRSRIRHWAVLLPALDQQSASDWSMICTLLAELKNPSDVDFILNCLRRDHEQLDAYIVQRQENRRAYVESGRLGSLPSSLTPCSHDMIFKRALWGYTDETTAVKISCLLDEPRDSAFAAHWLATHFGAPSSDNGAANGSRNKFSLISERSQRAPEFSARVAPIVAQIRRQIEMIAENQQGDYTLLLLAVARFEGAPAGEWILSVLERYSPTGNWEQLLHSAILVGAQFSCDRLLPFVQRTIHAVESPKYFDGQHDTYRITTALECLLFSDQPTMAFDRLEVLMKGPGRIGENDLASLIQLSRWVHLESVDTRIKPYLTHESEQVRAAAFLTAIERADKGGKVEQIYELAKLFAMSDEMRRSEGDWVITQRMARLLEDNPEFYPALILESSCAESLVEARRWLLLLNCLGGEAALNAAFDIAERWGETNVCVVSSLAPSNQQGGSLHFNGTLANWRRNFHLSRSCRDRLRLLESSADEAMRSAATRALNWIERERLGAGS
jgi:hypothetical protein